MHRLDEVAEHRAQAGGVGDDAGEVAQLAADPVELGVDTLGGPAGGAVAVVPIPVEILVYAR